MNEQLTFKQALDNELVKLDLCMTKFKHLLQDPEIINPKYIELGNNRREFNLIVDRIFSIKTAWYVSESRN